MRTHRIRSRFHELLEIGGMYGACSPGQDHTRAPDQGGGFAARHDDQQWLYPGRQRTRPIKHKLYARAYLGYVALRPASINLGQKTHCAEKCIVGMGQETACTAASRHNLKGCTGQRNEKIQVTKSSRIWLFGHSAIVSPQRPLGCEHLEVLYTLISFNGHIIDGGRNNSGSE